MLQVGNLGRNSGLAEVFERSGTGHLELRMADMRLPNNVARAALVRDQLAASPLAYRVSTQARDHCFHRNLLVFQGIPDNCRKSAYVQKLQ